MSIESLVARLEKATGPDRALDCKIWLALYDKQIMVDGGGYSPNAKPPKYESARKIWGDDWPHWGERSQVEHGVAIELDAPRYTGSMDAVLKLLPPGFWWRGGTCCVSSEAIVCPDHNNPDHRVRLLVECPPTIEHWNNGIEVEIRPGSDNALIRALASACLRAHAALKARSSAMASTVKTEPA